MLTDPACLQYHVLPRNLLWENDESTMFSFCGVHFTTTFVALNACSVEICTLFTKSPVSKPSLWKDYCWKNGGCCGGKECKSTAGELAQFNHIIDKVIHPQEFMFALRLLPERPQGEGNGSWWFPVPSVEWMVHFWSHLINKG
jgi:hypothetical protein